MARDNRYKNAGWMYARYHIDGMTVSEIADACGIQVKTATYWLKRLGVTDAPKTLGTGGESDSEFGSDTYRSREWLHEHYVERGLSANQIADLCDVTSRTITSWMRRHEIPTRTGADGVRRRYEHDRGAETDEDSTSAAEEAPSGGAE